MHSLAQLLLSSGLNVLPLQPGTKKPQGLWSKYQSTFYDGSPDAFWAGMGVVSGKISGGLVILDIDGGIGALREFVEGVKSIHPQALEDVVLEKSPSKGFHLAYLCPNLPDYTPKVWKREGRVLLEMRGDRQFTVIAPTPGYELITGDWSSLPKKTPLEHELFLSVANKMGESFTPRPSDVIARTSEERPEEAGGQRGEIRGPTGTETIHLLQDDAPRFILKSLGASYLSTQICKTSHYGQFGNEEEYWKRPRKDGEKGGLSYFPQKGIVHCFSDNCSPLLPDNGYTPLDLFSTVVMNEHTSMKDGRSDHRKNCIRKAGEAVRKGAWEKYKAGFLAHNNNLK